jgi:hypothetical protein
MKKYLMTGIAVLALCAGFTSCSKDLTPASQQEINQAKYEAAFVKRFGEPASNQTWGFGVVKSRTITRGQDANGNQWGDNYYNVPAPLTTAQIKVVTDWFTANHNPQGVAINYTDYFAQQVSSTSYGAGMDYLFDGATTGDGHIANFNKGDQGVYKGVYNGVLTDETIGMDYNDRKKAVYYDDKITHMVETSTNTFSYWNSSDSERYYDYVIIPGEQISPIVAGRYFVAFDYKQIKDDGTKIVNLDGYYNDWIISITPGIKKDAQRRVIAEDLSVDDPTHDFDFNDVVFDVTFTSSGAEITLLAAGGTLELTVGGHEVHEEFGVSTSTMVNTSNGTVKKDPVKFNITGNFGWDANNIPVMVKKDGEWNELTAVRAKAPSKICVETYYQWCNERQDIEGRYPRFPDWVKDTNVKWY